MRPQDFSDADLAATTAALTTFIIEANAQLAQWEAVKAEWRARWIALVVEVNRRAGRTLALEADPVADYRELAYRSNAKRWGFTGRPTPEERRTRHLARMADWRAKNRAKKRAAAGLVNVPIGTGGGQ